MRRLIASGALAALLLVGVSPLVASATAPEECVPQDAWTEVIEHPTQGEEFIEVIVTEAWTEVIEHPAVFEDVYHEAEYATEYQYRKEVRGDVWQRDNGKGQWHKTGQKFDWTWWNPASIQWSDKDVNVLQSGPHNGVVEEWTQGKHQWRKVSTEYRYVKTGETRQGKLLKEPWTESVLVTEAWTETIEHEATYKTVENPDYVPAWTETIEHEAVVCPAPEPEPEVSYYKDQYEYSTCEGLFRGVRLWQVVEGEEPVLLETIEEKVRDLTEDEAIELGCVEPPPPPAPAPAPEESVESWREYDCGEDTAVVYYERWVREQLLIDNVWVTGDWVLVDEWTEQESPTAQELEGCPSDDDDTPKLAETGARDAQVAIGWALLLLIGGGALVGMRRMLRG